jgi:hypothetical protein
MQTSDRGPLILAADQHFFVGGSYVSTADGEVKSESHNARWRNDRGTSTAT